MPSGALFCCQLIIAIIWIFAMTGIIIDSLSPNAREQMLQYQLDHIDQNPHLIDQSFHNHRSAVDDPNDPDGHQLLDTIEFKEAVAGLGLAHPAKHLEEGDKVVPDLSKFDVLKKDQKLDIVEYRSAVKAMVAKARVQYRLHLEIENTRPICFAPLGMHGQVGGNDAISGIINFIILIVDLIQMCVYIVKCPFHLTTGIGALVIAIVVGFVVVSLTSLSAAVVLVLSLVVSVAALHWIPEVSFILAILVFFVGIGFGVYSLVSSPKNSRAAIEQKRKKIQ